MRRIFTAEALLCWAVHLFTLYLWKKTLGPWQYQRVWLRRCMRRGIWCSTSQTLRSHLYLIFDIVEMNAKLESAHMRRTAWVLWAWCCLEIPTAAVVLQQQTSYWKHNLTQSDRIHWSYKSVYSRCRIAGVWSVAALLGSFRRTRVYYYGALYIGR